MGRLHGDTGESRALRARGGGGGGGTMPGSGNSQDGGESRGARRSRPAGRIREAAPTRRAGSRVGDPDALRRATLATPRLGRAAGVQEEESQPRD